MNYLFLAAIGMAGGIVISAGVFALITSTKLMSRLAGKTHTGKYIRLYEDIVVIGGTLFNILYVYKINISGFLTTQKTGLYIGIGGILLFAIFVGMFVGCLAVALAEVLKATAIFSRRVKLKSGVQFIVLAVALGKITGIIFQFFVL